MSRRALFAVAFAGAAACRSTRPAKVAPGVAAAAVEAGAAGADGAGADGAGAESKPGPAMGTASAAPEGTASAGATSGPAAALAAGDEALRRGDVDAALATWEQAAQGATDPAPLLDRAARARKDRAVRVLQKPDGAGALPAAALDAAACAADAHRSWSTRFPAAQAQGDAQAPAEVYARVGVAGAEALYLEAVCTAAWARTQGFTQLVDRRVEVLEALKRAARLAPDLDGAGPHRELGRLYAALPSYAGGDLTEARRELEVALVRAPSFAANHLELARAVAVKAQDRALFEAQLKQVADGEDKAAGAEAADLLAREEDLFGPAQAAQPTPGGPAK